MKVKVVRTFSSTQVLTCGSERQHNQEDLLVNLQEIIISQTQNTLTDDDVLWLEICGVC